MGGARISVKEVIVEKNSSLSAHPNPFSDKASLTVYDMKGTLLSTLFEGVSEKERANQVEMNGKALKNGLYVLRLVTPGKVSYQKLVLAK